MSHRPEHGIDQRNLEQENTADYRAYTIEGPPARLGEQLSGHHRGYDGPRLADLSRDQIAFARECAHEARLIYPPLIEELEAWADAGQLQKDEAYFYISIGMTKTSRQGRSRRASTRVAADENRQCSTVGLMTPGGPVVGRNFDLFYRVRVRHLITTRPEMGLIHTGMYDGLVAGRTDGLNEKGLFVSLQTVRTKPPGVRKPGLFCVHIARLVLETCSTAQEAAAKIALVPHLASYNYFLADPGEMLVVEAHPERIRARRAEDGVLACANHYAHPDMIELMRAEPPSSRAREEFLSNGARQIRDTLGEQGLPEAAAASATRDIASLMRDHTVPVCGHVDGMATLWSSIAAPRLRWIAFAAGAPCRKRYVESPLQYPPHSRLAAEPPEEPL